MAKVRVIKEATDIFPQYQPKVGKVYEAKYIPRSRKAWGDGTGEFCVINILDKRIILRSKEFELLEA